MGIWRLLVVGIGLAGCATTEPAAEQPVRAEYDPLEPLNRVSYAVSDSVDRYTLKPVARGYRKVVPKFARRGVTNFSQNLMVPRSAVNNFLQGKGAAGLSDLGRFVINSTFGIAGLFDLASAGGVEKYDETFSQTLAVWGVPEGPFVYIPFLGPNSLLDAVTLPIDMMSDPLYHYDNSSVRDPLYVLRAVNLRTRLLSADSLIADSKDPYLTIRESYLQNRAFQVHDGDPPTEVEDALFDEFFDEE